ncbi:hypothetical protein SAMN04487765_2021 [Tenacibaculum sp. MAR_2010_89]|uniref:hypothetical protein n=1 Tax=Tenacibaculum sp. MAR_2010_89 TaxID=1250198 RepID=UPI00089CA1BC|nr:hypothetical protein [Tenacibaculum sp. MAR_2010_89]SEE28944.1 hypothetical protein SAMN04487765_2021 [Tenacibaculum sp. MAR_2010_89]
MSKKSTYLNLVNKEYRKDWQFAMDVMKNPIVKPATSVIFIVPILLSILNMEILGDLQLPFQLPFTLWLSWISAILYLIALTIYRIYCPKFIQEYRDFGQFFKRVHSHRWIVWEFYYNILKYETWELLRESYDKNISTVTKDEVLDNYFNSNNLIENKVEMQKPKVEGRDIVLPFRLENNKNYLLKISEDDNKLDEKEKELFWMLYTSLTKQNEKARTCFWNVIFLMIFSVSSIVICNIIKVFV